MTATIADVRSQALAWYKYLNQGETWVPNGKPALPIAEMDAAWRFNAANWLLRRAKNLAFLYGMGEITFIFGPEAPIFAPMGELAQDALDDALDEGQRQRDADPEAWLKTTPLYQALVKDLPADAGKHARHWSDCDLRTSHGTTCTCWKRHTTECPVNMTRDIDGPCHCNDTSPEWTTD